ncbi:hypothetical protein AB6A40_005654 [Gnathostoma spinigerum]|uniref:Uncharacterized protein n=1 Tax=Gnathostoma spinigerum TaxID=75299 RepID=A0ABD6ERQ3_9BILA
MNGGRTLTIKTFWIDDCAYWLIVYPSVRVGRQRASNEENKRGLVRTLNKRARSGKADLCQVSAVPFR